MWLILFSYALVYNLGTVGKFGTNDIMICSFTIKIGISILNVGIPCTLWSDQLYVNFLKHNIA